MSENKYEHETTSRNLPKLQPAAKNIRMQNTEYFFNVKSFLYCILGKNKKLLSAMTPPTTAAKLQMGVGLKCEGRANHDQLNSVCVSTKFGHVT